MSAGQGRLPWAGIAVTVLVGLGFLSAAGLLPGGDAVRSVAFQLPEFGLLTLAMALTLIAGGINLAVVATANLSAIVAILAFHALAGSLLGSLLPPLLGLACGLLVGALAGLVIAVLQVTPVIATLSVMLIATGLGVVITGGGAITGVPAFLPIFANATLAGLPVLALFFLLVGFAVALILERTPFGFRLRATGLNSLAASFSGVPVAGVQIAVYALSGLLSALAGLVMLARFNSARMGYADSYLLVTLLAAVLGGVSPAGGRGRLSGLLLAVIILQGSATLLNLAGISQYASGVAWGVILLAKLSYDRFRPAFDAARMKARAITSPHEGERRR